MNVETMLSLLGKQGKRPILSSSRNNIFREKPFFESIIFLSNREGFPFFRLSPIQNFAREEGRQNGRSGLLLPIHRVFCFILSEVLVTQICIFLKGRSFLCHTVF